MKSQRNQRETALTILTVALNDRANDTAITITSHRAVGTRYPTLDIPLDRVLANRHHREREEETRG